MIPLRDLPDEPPHEPCCFCRVSTTLWTDLPDRAPGAQVACCRPCSKERAPAEVPTKRAWFEKERAIPRGHWPWLQGGP